MCVYMHVYMLTNVYTHIHVYAIFYILNALVDSLFIYFFLRIKRESHHRLIEQAVAERQRVSFFSTNIYLYYVVLTWALFLLFTS